MKLTRIAVIIGVVLGLSLIISGFYSQAVAGPGKVTINYLQSKKPAVSFDHAGHIAKPEFNKPTVCTACHSSATGGALVAAAKDPAKKGQFANVYHQAACLTCHKDLKAKNPATKAPTLCAGCHPAAAPAAK